MYRFSLPKGRNVTIRKFIAQLQWRLRVVQRRWPRLVLFLQIITLAYLYISNSSTSFLRSFVTREKGCASVYPSATPLPLTVLASYPGSGNTWLRHLIQQATGTYTGSIYCDEELRDNGFPGECFRNLSVVVVKTHQANYTDSRLFKFKADVDRAILLIRNPYNMIKTRLNFKFGGHSGYAANIPESEWQTFVRKKTDRWTKFNLYWLRNFPEPLLVVTYENLQANLTREIRRIAKFLDFPVTKERLDCIQANSEGNFHRKKVTQNDVTYSSSMMKELDRVMEDVKSEIRKRYLITISSLHFWNNH